MKPEKDLCIVSCGARTPVGTTAPMSAAMVHADVSRLRRHPVYEDQSGERLVMGIASYLDDEFDIIERLKELTLPAIEESLQPLLNIEPARRAMIPVYIGCPETRPGYTDDTRTTLETLISHKLSEYHPLEFEIQAQANGHASGLIALESACLKIISEEAEFCFFGGMESYYDFESLTWLYAIERLKCSENRFGFTPGEAAGFCLLTSVETANRYNLPILAKIIAVSTTEEKQCIGEDSVCTGEGLTAALADVLQHLPENKKVNQVLCDLNGERYRTDEYGFAYLRNKDCFESANNIISPVNRWGDIGAATAPNLINIAIESGLNNYSRGPFNLIWTSSDSGKRSALLLELPQNDRANS